MSRRPEDDEIDPRVLATLSAMRDDGRDPGRLMAGRAAAIRVAGETRSPRRLRAIRRPRVLAPLLLAATLAVGVGGLVIASADALPDSSLYSVKRAVEDIRLQLTFGADSHARLELDLADRRTAEAVAMADRGRADLAVSAARDGEQLIADAARTLGRSQAGEEALEHASAVALPRLQEVVDRLQALGDAGDAHDVDMVRQNVGHEAGAPQSDGGLGAGNPANGDAPGDQGNGVAGGSGRAQPTPRGSSGSHGGGNGSTDTSGGGGAPHPTPAGPPTSHG